MTRKNSATRAVNDTVTAARLEDINQDIDDLYSEGPDRLRVRKAISGTPLRIDITAGAYYVGSTSGVYSGGTDIVVTDAVTNYVMIDNAGTITISTSARTAGLGRLAQVICSGGAVTSIILRNNMVFGGAALDINALTTDDSNGYLDKLIVYTSATGNVKRDITSVIRTSILQCGETIASGAITCLGTPTATAATASGSTSSNVNGIGYSTTYRAQAQSFALASATYLKKITVSLKKVGSPAGTLSLSLYETTGSHNNPAIVASNTISEASLTSSYVNYDFRFLVPPYVLTGTYYFKIYTSRADDTGNYVDRARGGAYASGDGFYVTNVGTHTSHGSDHNFTIFEQGYDGKLYNANAYSGNIEGVTLASGVLNDYIEVAYDGIVAKSGLTAGSSYYISTTAGTLTTTPTTRRIGTALTTGLLRIEPQTVEIVAGTAVTVMSNNRRGSYSNSTSYVKIKEGKIKQSGTYTTYFGLRGNAVAGTSYGRVYKNGVAVGTERSIASSPGTETFFSEDIAFVEGDTYELRAKVSVGTAGAAITEFKLTCAYGLLDNKVFVHDMGI